MWDQGLKTLVPQLKKPRMMGTTSGSLKALPVVEIWT